MSYVIEEVIKTMKMLDEASKKMPKPHLDPKAVKNGLELSKLVCRQAEEVVATPIMKNLMVALGDVKQYQDANGEWHTEKLKTGAKSKAVTWMNEVVHALLLKYNGPEKHEYNESCQVDDPDLYNTDCWNGWKETIWDIVPGQEEETRKAFLEFANQVTNLSVSELIALIKKDPCLQRTIEIELKLWPEVQASREVTAISDPFMSKKSGVSYPDYHNDSTKVPGTDITWGRYEIDLVKQAASKGLKNLLKFAYDNNVYTGYTRRQRGKGRPLIAQSRRSNLVVNLINGVEMEEWKKDPSLNMAFLPEDQILSQFAEMGDFLLANPDYDAYNVDGKAWDRNLGQGWVCLQDALRYILARGNYTKELVVLRYCLNSKGVLVDGLSNKVYEIFGRMFSGYLDTTLGNTGGNRLISGYYAMSTDPEYVKRVIMPTRRRNVKCVGDDTLVILKKGVLKNAVKIANNNARIVIHEDEKHARGLMFIQWRAIKVDGKWIMLYNWPRVLRSMLSKEDAKQLGQAGWTLAFYQQLGKLRMWPKYLAIVLNIAAALDKDHLMLNVPVRQIIKMANQEDSSRIKEGAKNKRAKMKRTTSTAEKLYNGNPDLPGVKRGANGELELDTNYFVKLQKELKAVYSSDFLTSNGFKVPDISKVH